ncbi:MAG: radical SAM protein [Nanoarchaeota archaeon]|nr:radical SAM protein [Nanoarchaeota archaeon]
MKFCFVNLPSENSIVRRFGCFFKSNSYLFPPLELLGLATLAKRDGCETKLIDCVSEKKGLDELVSEIKRFSPEIILFLLSFNDEEKDLEKVKFIKEKIPEVQIGCFGYSARFLADRLLDWVDFVINGEPEPVLKRILKKKKFSNIKCLSYTQGNKKVISDESCVADYSNLPFPDRRLINNSSYSSPFFGKPFTTIQASRGCPFKCSFCVHPFGKNYRLRSVESVLEELKEIIGLGVRYVRFVDDVFTLNERWVKNLCSAMLREKLDLNWECNSRAEGISEDTARLMKKAGCKRIFLGIESGSPRVLITYQKGYDLKRVKKQISILREAGLTVFGWFMVNPFVETYGDFFKSVEFAKTSGIDFLIVSQFSYNIGTFLKKPLKKKCSLSAHYMEKKFYKEFYLRPKNIVKLWALFLKHPFQVFDNFSGMIKLFAGRLNKFF